MKRYRIIVRYPTDRRSLNLIGTKVAAVGGTGGLERLVPLLVSLALEEHSAAMFDHKGCATLPGPKLADRAYVNAFVADTERLVNDAQAHQVDGSMTARGG